MMTRPQGGTRKVSSGQASGQSSEGPMVYVASRDMRSS